LAEVTYQDALLKHGCLNLKDLQFEAKFLTWNKASQNTFVFACHLTSTFSIKVSWEPFHPEIASGTDIDLRNPPDTGVVRIFEKPEFLDIQ